MHLQNLVPHTLACGGCRVHVSYAARSDVSEIDRMEDFVKWASSDLWVGVGAQLSSISVQDRSRSLEPSSTQEVGLQGDTRSSRLWQPPKNLPICHLASHCKFTACCPLPQPDMWGLLSICRCQCLAVSKTRPSDCWLNNCKSCYYAYHWSSALQKVK